MPRLLALATVCITVHLSTACLIKECTEIGCLDGIRFTMTPPVAAEVTIELTGDISLTCTQALRSGIGGCRDAGLTLSTDEQWRLASVEIGGRHPKAIAIRVLAAGVVEREVSATPKYRDDQPNGPDCGGCRVATVDVSE